MGKQNDTISQYLALTKKIQALEQTLTEKESELRRKYTADFSQIKKSLRGYMTKIRPTVEMVCDLYRLKVRFSGERIHTQEGVPTMDYDACTACEEAIRLGNEGIQLLSAVIQKNNVDVALREFAVRYNTVAEIHDNADLLITEATRRGVDACGQERIQLQAKRQSLCANDQEHRALTEAIQQCGEQLTQACILNERKEIQREFVSRITLPLGYESCDNRALGIRTEGCTVVSLLEWMPQEDNLMVIRADRQDIDSPELSTCAVNAVIQFLFAYPAASKKILLCDSRASDRITAFVGILKSTNTELFFDHTNGSYVKNSDEEIRVSLSEVNRTINQRIMTLSQSGYPDVLKYNRENQDNPMPILMVLLNGYPFDAKNNLLFLFGHYLDTKLMEASLIKDTLVLSRDVEEPTVYYVDYNKNATLRRAKTAIRRLRDKWVLSGKMVYSSSDEAENTFEELRQLIQNREDDDESALYPILVVIAKADELFADDDLCETLCALISRGKENNVYFAIQCNEPVRFYGCDRYVNDAILFPDRYSEGETYASDALCAALEAMPTGATDRGRKLIANASRSPLDPRLHILCDNNQISLFVPYEYDEDYLKNITN